MKKTERNVNKKLIQALIGYSGLNGQQLGRLCDPPVSRVHMHFLIHGKRESSPRLINQVTEILRPAAADLAIEALNLYDQDLLDALFPPVSHPESIAPVITEGNNSTLPEKKGEL